MSIGSDDSAGPTDGGAGDAGAISPDEDVAAAIAAACAPSPGSVQALTSTADISSAITGLWLLCGEPSAFGTTDEVGIQFNPDGEWVKLYARSDLVVQGTGTGQVGTWTTNVSADAGPFALNLTSFGSGVTITTGTVSNAPRFLILNETGFRATYAFYESI